MIPKPPEHVATIDDTDALRAFCERMRRRDWIAIDTEFLRERTYYPRLCLVQIADTREIALIDVLAIKDLSSLGDLLDDECVCKVFHSAEQDLEVLFQRFGQVPAPLFDTQIAAALVGHDDQMGYARMIAALLDTDLAKSHTRTDWSRRPLPAGALDYAADDVRYLAVAYRVLCTELAGHGRETWLDDDFDRLADPARFTPDPAQAWRRLRSWHRLRPAQQQALAALADWRERQAMAADRPRKWILGDDALMDIARRQPTDAQTLTDIHALPEQTAKRHGDALLRCVQHAAGQPDIALDQPPGVTTPREKRLIKAGMEKLAECARQKGISAAAIASRKTIAAIVAGERDVRLLSGWRAEAAGNAVLAAIDAAARFDEEK